MYVTIRKWRAGYIATVASYGKAIGVHFISSQADSLTLHEKGDRESCPVVHFTASDLLLLGSYGLFRPDYTSFKSEKIQ